MNKALLKFLRIRTKVALFLYDDLSKGHTIVQFMLDISSLYQDIAYMVIKLSL